MASDPRELFKKFPLVSHPEISEIFADQVGMTFFDGATLKIEFLSTRMNEAKPPAQPTGERHVICRLALTIPCVIDLITQMQMTGRQLANAGVIKTGSPSAPSQSTAKTY